MGFYEAPEVEATNATAQVDIAAPAAGEAVVLESVKVSYSAAPTGGTLTITDGSTVVLKEDITTAGEIDVALPGDKGLRCSDGNAVHVALSAGGAGIVGRVNAGYRIE